MERSNNCICLRQSDYIVQIIENFSMHNANSVRTSADVNVIILKNVDENSFHTGKPEAHCYFCALFQDLI